MSERIEVGTYKNGNYTVTIYSDGSKTRVTEGDAFIPSFPESIELKITNKYDGEHPWFSSNKPENQEDAKLMENNNLEPLNKYIKSIRPLTEVTIEGGHLDHPELLSLLCYFRRRRVPVKIIIGQDYFCGPEHLKYHRLLGWQQRGLMSNLGIILVDSENTEFIDKLNKFPNVTIIAEVGVFNGSDLDNLAEKGFNLLLRGYYSSDNNKEFSEKNFKDFEYNRDWLVKTIDSEVIPAFEKVSFDNLALSQLGIDDTRFTSKDKDENNLYFGNDGEFSLYIDMIKNEFSNSPYSKERYKIEDFMTSDKMFRELRKRRRL